jgi:hypothetical protein
MNHPLLAAGVICLDLSAGHTVIGVKWVLPRLPVESLPRSPLGGPRTTAIAIKITWYVVTICLAGIGGILIALAEDPLGASGTVAVTGISVLFLGITIVFLVLQSKRPSTFIRAPMSLLVAAVAVLCWIAR